MTERSTRNPGKIATQAPGGLELSRVLGLHASPDSPKTSEAFEDAKNRRRTPRGRTPSPHVSNLKFVKVPLLLRCTSGSVISEMRQPTFVSFRCTGFARSWSFREAPEHSEVLFLYS